MDAKKIKATGSLFSRDIKAYVYVDTGLNRELCVVFSVDDKDLYLLPHEVEELFEALSWASSQIIKKG